MTNYLSNKKIRLLLCVAYVVFVAALVFVMTPETVYAEPQETIHERMVTLTEPQDITISIWFDTMLPDIVFIAPDGLELPLSESALDGSDGIYATVAEKWALVRIADASAGEWYIRIEPLANTEVEYQVMGMSENISIQYINAVPDASGRVAVSFLVELGEEHTRYNYELCLSADYEQAGEVTLREGYATTGVEENLTVSLSNHASYDHYVLVLYVYKSVDGTELFDSLESASFSYINPNTLAAPDGIDVFVELGTRMVTVDWSAYSSRKYDSYFVTITADGINEPIYYSEFGLSENIFTQYIEKAYDSLTLSFRGRKNGNLSEPIVRHIDLSGNFAIEVITQSPTADAQAQIRMNLPDDTVMTVAVGDNEYVFRSDGSENVVAVDLVNGPNELYAYAETDEIRYCCSVDIYKDGIPPLISFFEPYDGQTFKDTSVTIVGSVSGAVRLRLGDEEILLDDDGSFSVDVSLLEGENQFTFVAEDNVGNRSSYMLNLYGKEEETSLLSQAARGGYLTLIIVGSVSFVIIIVLIILAVRKKQLRAFSFVPLIVLFSATTAGALAMFIRSILLNRMLTSTVESMSFSELVSESLKDAYALLLKLDSMPKHIRMWMWLTAASVSCLVLTILVGVIVKKVRIRRAAHRKSDNTGTEKK